MNNFEKVRKYCLEYDGWNNAFMEEDQNGDWVREEDYQSLLEEYKELKFRMDGLEK